MTINEATRAYRLPNPTTLEDLEGRFSGMDGKMLTFSDKVVITGYYWNGPGKPCYYGAVYEWLGEDHSCEGAVGLREVSDVEFEHDGDAVVWGIGR